MALWKASSTFVSVSSINERQPMLDQPLDLRCSCFCASDCSEPWTRAMRVRNLGWSVSPGICKKHDLPFDCSFGFLIIANLHVKHELL